MSEETIHTILVVDDEPTNVAILNAMLNKQYKIKVALNGHDAIKVANTIPYPDLILLDVVMENMDGFEVCTRLKQNQSTRNIPVIFVTALRDIKNDRKGLELGAIDFFSKPFSAPIIKKRIENHLSLAKLSRELRQIKDANNELINKNNG